MKNSKGIMISCKEATYLASKQVDSPLSLPQRIKLRIHFMLCKPCLYFSKQVKIIHGQLKRFYSVKGEHFSDQEKQKLSDIIQENL
jgi:hypothetical protein